MAINVNVAGEGFVAESYESAQLPGRPARLSARISLPEGRAADDLEPWLGQEVTVSEEGAVPWTETRRVVRIRAEGADVTLWGEGATGALDGRPALSAWTDAAPVDVAEEVLDRAGARVETSLDSSAATEPAQYLLQNQRTDRSFLDALARAYGFAMFDLANGDVAVANTAPGESHTIERASECNLIHELRLPASERVSAVFEKDGEFELLEASAAEAAAATFHDQPVIWPGFVPHREHLATLIEGHADGMSLSRRAILVVPRGDLHVGDLVEGDPIRNEMAVVGRRTTLEHRGIVSTLELVEPAQFAAALTPPCADKGDAKASPPFTLATVAEPHLEERPGWCRVVVPGIGDDAPFPAQLLAWGGGADGGPSLLPESEATVLVAFVGDAVIPRLEVLGVCRHGANPPATTDSGVSILRFGEDEGGTMLYLDASGTVTIKGANLNLHAKERFAVEANEIQLIGPAIEFKRG